MAGVEFVAAVLIQKVLGLLRWDVLFEFTASTLGIFSSVVNPPPPEIMIINTENFHFLSICLSFIFFSFTSILKLPF